MSQKYLYQEDDALINGRDPDYRGIHEWWERQFPGRKFSDDWRAAEQTETDGGDCFTRTLVVDGVSYEVMYSPDGYAVLATTTQPDRVTQLSNELANLALIILGQHLWSLHTRASLGPVACLCRACEAARRAHQIATSYWPTTEQEHQAMKAWGWGKGQNVPS